jgi:hypothetical protein
MKFVFWKEKFSGGLMLFYLPEGKKYKYAKKGYLNANSSTTTCLIYKQSLNSLPEKS